MTCMKCGTQIPESQVFCDHCLSVMENYPIKPGTHIHLPKRALAVDTPKKTAKKKKVLTQEEQISALRMKVLRLRLLAAVLAFLFVLASGLLVLRFTRDTSDSALGRNYIIDTSMND